MNLADKFGAGIHASKEAAIAEAQKAAREDIIRQTIDPNRVENEAAYSAVVIRNNLHSEYQKRSVELDDPASPASNMDPEEYSKVLRAETEAFYKANSKSKFAGTNAEVFSRFTLANQDGLIAKQSKQYKDNLKRKHQEAALTALASPPPGTGESFELNTAIIFDQMLPSDRFTTEERRQLGMKAAIAAAHQGDSRPLDYMRKFYDADAMHPVQVEQAKSAYTEAQRLTQDAMYTEVYAEKESLARSGGYSEAQWESDIRDQELTRRFSRGQVDEWLRTSRAAHRGEQNRLYGKSRFMAGKPLVGLPKADQQAIIDEVRGDTIQKYAQQMGQGPEATLAGMHEFSSRLAQSGLVSDTLKLDLQSRLLRPVFTVEQAMDPEFQEAVVMFGALRDTMTNEQLIDQVGKDTIIRATLWDDALAKTGGNPENAAKLYIAEQNAAKENLALQGGPSSRINQNELDEIQDGLLNGSLSGSDPAARQWGFRRPAAGGIFTAELMREFRKEYDKMVNLHGMSHESAKDLATRFVANNSKVFAGDLHYTGGVSMQKVLNMPNGSTNTDLKKAWEVYAQTIGLNPDNTRMQVVGKYIHITDNEGTPIEGAPMPYLFTIGQVYDSHLRAEEEGRAASDLNASLIQLEDNNRSFANMLVSKAEVAKQGDIRSLKFLKDGTTIGNYLDSDGEGQLILRKQYAQESKGLIAASLKPLVNFIQDVKAGKYQGQAYDRFRQASIANQDSPLVDKPKTETPAPEQVGTEAAPAGSIQEEDIPVQHARGGGGDTVSTKTDPYRGVEARPAPAPQFQERGLRNNNPGNIERGTDKWKGASPSQDDDRFLQFDSPEAGIRAMARILGNYKKEHKISTLADAITRWSPPSENDTAGYIQFVSDETGIKPDARIDLDSPAVLPIMAAMIQKENGQQPYSLAIIKAGFDRRWK
jgi:hypothetical protein